MNYDSYGQPICPKCSTPKPPTVFGLTGICHSCYLEYVAQQATLNALRSEINAILAMIPSRRL